MQRQFSALGLKIRTLTLYFIKLSYLIFHPFEVVSRGNLK